MKKEMLWIAIGALLLPLVARGLWFYHGVSVRPAISTPDYASLSMPPAPLETPVSSNEKIKQLGGTVLVDYTHANQFQQSDIQSLKDDVEKRGGKLEFLSDATLLENHLKYASSYLVFSPSAPFTSIEINLIQTFVNRGGRLAVFTDATRGMVFSDFFTGATTTYPDTNAVNPILEPFGISVDNDYMYNLEKNEGNFRNVFFDKFGKAELTFGLKQIALYGTHSVKSDSGLVLLRGTETTFSSVSDAYDPAEGGAAISEDGNVVAFGDFTFLTPPYDHVADNSILIANIADFLLGGKRAPSLVNFPYIFNQPVLQVFPTSDVQMTAEMVGAFSSLQASLGAMNISMQIVTEKPAEGDVLQLGIFTSSDDLDAISNKFNLNFDESSDYVTVPGFGQIGRTGNGLLLFDANKKGNTLVLLSDTLDDLKALVDILSSGSLTSCIVQDKTGVCSVGFGGTFSSSDSVDEGTATPEAEATPAG